jgi:hypothetical protein
VSSVHVDEYFSKLPPLIARDEPCTESGTVVAQLTYWER